MYYWKDLAEVPAGFGPTAVTVGNFDGVHRGHQQVLRELTAQARKYGITATAVTFDPHPSRIHRPDTAPELIMGLQDRLETMAATGIDAVLVVAYSLEFSRLSPEEFVRSILLETLGATVVVIGHDTRFGHGNSGDVDTMLKLGEKFGFEVEIIEEFGSLADASASRRCSSTWVREALSAGDVRTAAMVLGRPHRLRGEVVHGAARGRELGFPTANLASSLTGYIPADGIYAGWLTDESGQRWPAAISVGSNPTFAGVSRQVEAHVIDRPEEAVEDFDLYDQVVVLEFLERLRGMVAYSGPEALVEQMRRDVLQAHDLLRPSADTIST